MFVRQESKKRLNNNHHHRVQPTTKTIQTKNSNNDFRIIQTQNIVIIERGQVGNEEVGGPLIRIFSSKKPDRCRYSEFWL